MITLQVLNGPNIDSVRSEDGAAKAVPVTHQRLFPKWMQFVLASILLFGLLSFFYMIGWMLTRL